LVTHHDFLLAAFNPFADRRIVIMATATGAILAGLLLSLPSGKSKQEEEEPRKKKNNQ